MTERWISYLKHEGEEIRLKITRTLKTVKTPYQQIDVCETEGYGLSLYLDGKPQSSEVDEDIYHESLVQPAMLAHPEPRRVFIAGGAEGATLREVLRHPSVERAVMVDIDAEAVAACRELLPAWHRGSFEDPRVEVIHTDARAWLAETDERFDVAIIDITDPIEGSPACLLFTDEFYRIVHGRLSDDGLMVVQAENTAVNYLECHLAILHTIGRIFRHAMSYSANIPFFDDCWGFVLASKEHDPARLSAEEVEARLQRRGIDGLRFYDGPQHTVFTIAPRYIREGLRDFQRVITDANPFYVV